MIKFIKDIFSIDKNPHKGLFAFEWTVVVYLVATALILLFIYTKAYNPEEMIWGRVRILFTMAALWAVYKMVPCRFTLLARVAAQLAFLSWWYPDTYEFNRLFPNLDHVFAVWEQDLFGCQPALLFSQFITNHIFSELMNLGYSSYYFLIFVVEMYYFIFRYKDFEKTSFIVLTSFLIFFFLFICLPVAGPQFYYAAVGTDKIAQGIFPNIGDYFRTHQEILGGPGWTDGFFYHIVEDAQAAGERPTAAFPSSHVGIATIIVMLSIRTKEKYLLFVVIPLYVLLCFATVYIQAHYAIDAIAGLFSGVLLYYITKILYEHAVKR